jgi:hypothetical protein
MDTLRVVKLIRESEALAESGRHEDACRVLKGMLDEPGLSESHRTIVVKKHALYERQRDRISRRSAPAPEPRPAPALDTNSDTVSDLSPEPAERPTDKVPHPEVRGLATEVVPKHESEPDKDPAPKPKGPNDTDIVLPETSSARSSAELRAIAERLPEDDLRRMLALEVVELRDELERVSRRNSAVKSDSSRFRIPVSDANTIVRSAAGDSDIEVHLPGRDENADDLMVLRRDKLAPKVPAPLAAASDVFAPEQSAVPSLFRPLATYLGFAVIVVLAGWVVYVGVRAVTSAPETRVVGADGVGELRLRSALPQDMRLTREGNALREDKSGMLVHLDTDGLVAAISIPGSAHPDAEAAERFGVYRLAAAEGGNPDWSIHGLRAALGESVPAYDAEAFASRERGVLRFELGGAVVLEAHYRTSTPDRPEWIRLIDTQAELTLPTLHEGHDSVPDEDT